MRCCLSLLALLGFASGICTCNPGAIFVAHVSLVTKFCHIFFPNGFHKGWPGVNCLSLWNGFSSFVKWESYVCVVEKDKGEHTHSTRTWWCGDACSGLCSPLLTPFFSHLLSHHATTWVTYLGDLLLCSFSANPNISATTLWYELFRPGDLKQVRLLN